MSRVQLGTGERYPAGSPGIRAALADGHRWLVLTDQDQPFNDGPVDLSAFTGKNDLKIEGGGHRITNLARGGNWPLFFTSKDEYWQLHFQGITLVGAGHDESLIDMANIDSSTFTQCSFLNVGDKVKRTGQPAVRLGVGGQCSTTRFLSCWAEDCGGTLYHIENGVDIGWRDGYAQRSDCAIYFRGKQPNEMVGVPFIDGVHFEQNGRWENHVWTRHGIDIDWATGAVIKPSYRYLTSLVLGPNANNCVVNVFRNFQAPEFGMGVNGNRYAWG